MVTPQAVEAWLRQYVEAWKSYDPQTIGDLFTEDARYFYGPYDAPLEGRAAIIASWLADRDKPGTYTGEYHLLMAEGNRVVTNGRSTYFGDDGKTPIREYDNIFVLEFDDRGRCRLFREWYMGKPDHQE